MPDLMAKHSSPGLGSHVEPLTKAEGLSFVVKWLSTGQPLSIWGHFLRAALRGNSASAQPMDHAAPTKVAVGKDDG